MAKNKKIAWEKFIPKYESKSIKDHEDDDEDNDQPTYVDQDDEEDGEMPAGIVNIEDFLIRRKVKTPFGYYELDDDFSPYNMFDCWIGHTNFRLTMRDFDVLDKRIEGIGCLKVLSPYRFFIGIEKMFTFSSVRLQIQDELCTSFESQDMISDLGDDVFAKINDALFNIKDSEKWAVFVGKDGEIKIIKNSEFESDNEYENTLNNLKSLKNGNIITYDSL